MIAKRHVRSGISSGVVAPPTKRVAIYTRKSTDEGLDREFNSLDAQRQAVEAYVLSQRGEGWAALPERYDDGGFTGANTDRPAFQRLLADVRAGKVDIVASYKLDRLSRSLADFIQAIKLLEQNGVAFVSVTQGFNTTTSTGRLLMNLLATFGEFERDQISERTRDKMRASRRRGLFVGGRPVLGYDVREKKLVINAAEAETVHEIFEIYVNQGSLLATVQDLARRGITTKRLVSAQGRVHAGRTFDKGALSRLLQNPVYVGKIEFEGQVIQGNHPAILDEKIWNATQELLRSHDRSGVREDRNRWGALLTGIAFCARCGGVLGHVAAQRGSRAYRYYVCQQSQRQGVQACPGSRAPAGPLETAVVQKSKCIGRDQTLVAATVDAAKKLTDQKRPEILSGMRRHAQEASRFEAERTNLLSAIGEGGAGTKSLVERLAEVGRALDGARSAERDLRAELDQLDGGVFDADDLQRALAEFEPIWNELFPREQARVLRLLIEKVTYAGETGEVEISFRSNGLRTLAAQCTARTA